MITSRNRREFLKGCCAVGAAGWASQFSQLGMLTAHAQTVGDYKALVCIFMFGGNDANNMVVPKSDSTAYNLYSAMRGPVALPQASLLDIGGSVYGLHPSLPKVQAIFNHTNAATSLTNGAMVFNVGSLVQPTTKAQLGTTPLPRNLYSHSDQTQQWQSSDPTGGATGWGGRVNDILTLNPTGGTPPGITVNGGNALFLSGPTTKGLNFSNASTAGLTPFGGSTGFAARKAALQEVLTFDTGLRMVGPANGILGGAIQTMETFNAALQGIPQPTGFPATGLGSQLAQVFRIMQARGTLGMRRQIFFAGMGGFDNHEQLVANQANLMRTLDDAIGAFFTAVNADANRPAVTLFTESEFNRTGDSNANVGSDHAWGSHMMVFGDAVRPGTYGTFPRHELRGPDDAGNRGYWIPTTAVDQYAASLASWFGVGDTDLGAIFPNLANFPGGRLGFI